MNVNIKEKLYLDIKSYCDLNNLPIGEYINKLVHNGFMRDKYGEKPNVKNETAEKNTEFLLNTPELESQRADLMAESCKRVVKKIMDDAEKAIQTAKEEEIPQETEKIVNVEVYVKPNIEKIPVDIAKDAKENVFNDDYEDDKPVENKKTKIHKLK